MSDISVGVHATIIRISVDGQTVFLPRAQASEFLAEFMQAMAETIPDNYSRKVPDTPALRLADRPVDVPSWQGGRSGYFDEGLAFHCDPDPSCGQKDGAA